jgi:hypothetical protein
MIFNVRSHGRERAPPSALTMIRAKGVLPTLQ